MRTYFAALLLLSASTIALARTDQRLQVTSPRELMVKAIDAPDGCSAGELRGEIADAFAMGFRTTSPLYIDVRTIVRYAQPGCRRLNVTFWQDGVALPGAPGEQKQTIEFGINYCRDGRAPRTLRLEGSP